MSDITNDTLTARELGIRSRAAVHARDRDGWLDLFADDALVQDPIGPSPSDPEGKGHYGKEAIAAFYDNVIAPARPSTSKSPSRTSRARRLPTSASSARPSPAAPIRPSSTW